MSAATSASKALLELFNDALSPQGIDTVSLAERMLDRLTDLPNRNEQLLILLTLTQAVGYAIAEVSLIAGAEGSHPEVLR